MLSNKINPNLFTAPQLGKIISEAIIFFENTQVMRLPPNDSFSGAGVYGIYYNGDYPPYKVLSDLNKSRYCLPIYVGKAVPPGWRTARSSKKTSTDLFRRLTEHAKSINSATNLKLNNFSCRYIILSGEEANLISSVEAYIIRKYKPLWNNIIDGFGNHDPGKGRSGQKKSEWDIIHPGRAWVNKLTGVSVSKEKILKKIETYMKDLDAS